jgi:hypothetical protein
MTGFSTPFPGSLSAGLNTLSAPIGSGPPASLLAQLLNRTSAVNSLPGSAAPQLPMLPRAPRGALGPVPGLPSPALPPQNNLMSSLMPMAGGFGQLFGNTGGTSASQGLFGNQGPLFGVGGLFGPKTGLEGMPTTATVNGTAFALPDEWGGMGALYGNFGSGAGAAALSGAADAAAATAPDWLTLAGLAPLGL